MGCKLKECKYNCQGFCNNEGDRCPLFDQYLDDDSKAIEELVRLICPNCPQCLIRYDLNCSYLNIAKKIYDNGYRKESYTAKNILKAIYDICKERKTIQWDDIYYLLLKYNVEVEW